jgi:TetR/AcrR family transcriptional repressor of nem operon
MNAKADKKEQSHAEILASAARLIREKGVAKTSVAEVMKGAGLTVGGFYAHFASKEALIDEVIRRAGAETRERLLRGLDEKPPEARARAVLDRYLSANHRDATSKGCPLPAVAGELTTGSDEHREALGEHVARMATELEPLLAAVGRCDSRDLALGVVALMYGGLSLSRALQGSELSDEILTSCRTLAESALGSSGSPAGSTR